MIDRLQRRLSVRARIYSGYLILLVLAALALPLVIANQAILLARLRQISEVEAQANRMLLLASTRVASSRVNLMRYMQDYAPSAYEALDDVDLATDLLQTVNQSEVVPKEDMAELLGALEDYRQLVEQVQAARSAEGATAGSISQETSRNLFEAYRLGNDIGQRIEQIVTDSESKVAASNQAVYTQAERRLALLATVYAVLIVLAFLVANLIQRSITRPVAELREGAESFQAGRMDVTIPVTGTDELSLLAETFNDMAARSREMVGSLEERVRERTQEVERRAMQLTTAAEVGQAVTSVLDLPALSQQVVDVIRERFDLYHVGLFLVNDRYAVLEAATGEAGRQMKEAEYRLEVGGLSLVGTACALRRVQVAQDVGRDAVHLYNPLLPEARTEVALPLQVGNRVVGALDVQSKQVAAFAAGTDDLAALQLIADQVTIAVENARLFTEMQAALTSERRAYGALSRAAWAQLLKTQATPGYRSDDKGLHPLDSASADSGPGEEPASQPETLRMLIRVRGREIGSVEAEKPDGSGAWTEEELMLFQVLLDQLGAALEGAQLYHDVQLRAARERLTSEVTARLRETLDVDRVLQAAAYELGEMFNAAEVKVRLTPGQQGHPGTGGLSESQVQGQPGDSGRVQGQPGDSGRVQGQPGNSRRVQGQPGDSRRVQGQPGNSGRVQGQG